MTPLKFVAAVFAAASLSMTALPVSAHDVEQNASTTGEEVFKLGQPGMEQLMNAVREFGLDDRPVRESYAEVSAGGTIYQSMSLESFTKVPPSALYEKPVPFGVAYYNSEDSGIRPGQYLLQVQSSEQIEKPGMYPGVVSMVDLRGETVAKIEVELDAFAMEPAPLGDWEGTVITPAIRYRDEMAQGFFNPIVVIGFWCTNGLHIIDIIITTEI